MRRKKEGRSSRCVAPDDLVFDPQSRNGKTLLIPVSFVRLPDHAIANVKILTGITTCYRLARNEVEGRDTSPTTPRYRS